MKEITADVKSRMGAKSGPRKLVGSIKITEAETLDEFVQMVGGEENALKLGNTQFATNLKNEARRLSNVTLSDRKVREQAVAAVLDDKAILQSILQEETTQEDAIAVKMTEIRAAHEAAQAAAVTPVAAGAGAATDDAEDSEDDD